MTSIKEIEQFWNTNPCGETLVGREEDWREFFKKYDAYRYRTEGHILKELDALNLKNKQVLEIGIGQGADSEQIIRRGGRWHGLDLTAEAVLRTKKRFDLFHLPFQAIKQGSAGQIPYPDRTFDIVYSHGVLHHIPDIRTASQEIRRVLKPGGTLVIMLYHSRSLNYRISINIARRIFMIALFAFGKLGGRVFMTNKILLGHLANARCFGLFTYLKNPLFMMRNTDGPENPYSKVYDLKEVDRDFADFKVVESRAHFLNERHLPLLKLLPTWLRAQLAARYGWHLWVRLT